MTEDSLRFSLTTTNRSEWMLYMQAPDMHCALYHLSQWIRSKWKYTDEETINIEELRKVFWDTLSDYNVSLD